ncbi:hypothetical protein DAPPUDRAFT_254353 [Daphnia pulex]|uniref:Uncharacterized protein n=1 Tax=Daphnia pulex TaxID=6669 RepID=E9H6Z3_DAPPU|nr:hypothetical protein DAPPUDRAFT_254353 [Daphnia pulex]|eukprot:EFX72528.1 hypothetical protein DAPPUDRAFT_254353 [Daphnia pulex]
MATANGGDDLNTSGNPARPPSRSAADVQTDHTARYPPLNTARDLKQQRSNEKSRLTRLATKIAKHTVDRGSRTILRTYRDQFSTQRNLCMTIHNNYCSAKRSVDEDDKRWVDEINDNTKRIFDNIDNYILNTPRPPSNAAPGTPVRLSPANSAPSHHSSHRQLDLIAVAIPSLDFARALDHEKKRCIELEKQLAQMQLQEKEKLNGQSKQNGFYWLQITIKFIATK